MINQRRFLLWRFNAVVVVSLLAVVVSGVLSGRTSAQDSASLTGEYSAAVRSRQVPKDVPNTSTLIGRWKVVFAEDGTYSAGRYDTGVLVNGTYSIDGDTVTITDESGIASCAAGIASRGQDVATGTYTWSKEGDLLTLSVVEDGCLFRSIMLTTGPLAAFVACGAPPVEMPEAAATPEAGDDGLMDLLTPAADDEGTVDGDVAEVTAEIDYTLSQLTACWAAADVDGFLALLTEESGQEFLDLVAEQMGTTDPEEVKGGLERIMKYDEWRWVRDGEVELTGPDSAKVFVQLTIGGEANRLPARFEREDGAWKWVFTF